MSERALTTDELIEMVRATRDKAEAYASELRYLVQQLQKQIEEGGGVDDRRHA